MRYLHHAIALTALTLAACGGGSSYGDGPTNPPGSSGNGNNGGSTSNAIAVADNSFTPSATTVARGTTVTWTWGGRAQHNVTFDDGPASATQSAGNFSRTFNAAGTFPYHCTIHGTAMAGTVTVP
jgi:plastocyanin